MNAEQTATLAKLESKFPTATFTALFRAGQFDAATSAAYDAYADACKTGSSDGDELYEAWSAIADCADRAALANA